MQNQQSKIIGSFIVLIVVSYFIGKNSNPAKLEVKTVEVEKIVYVESTNKAVASKKVSSSTTKPDGTKVEKTEETFNTSESAQIGVDSTKQIESQTKVKNSLFGLYGGLGVKLNDPLKKPYLSGIVTYNMFAIGVQTDLQFDHRVSTHIGLQF